VIISRLTYAALTLAAYASSSALLHSPARLASGWWLAFAVRESIPLDSDEWFQSSTSGHPPFPGFPGATRHYLCESFPTCLDPYPGGPQGAFTRFFPQGIGLPRSCSGSALHHILDSHFSPGGLFGAAAISSCSGPPVCLPPRWLPPPRPFQASGSRGFYFWAPHSSLPPRGPDMLAVRIEQLTAGRLALPKIRSLVGCTARPDPISSPQDRVGLRQNENCWLGAPLRAGCFETMYTLFS
jgi:hypothetical protein